jgi:hypothetical protein
MKRLMLLWAVCQLAGCSSQSDFQRHYDRYFPKDGGQSYAGGMRGYYDKWLFGPPPPKTGSQALWELYRAFHGDAAAAHLFFQNPDRDSNGEPGEAWGFDCQILLFRLGDTRFSQLLAQEDGKTREFAGRAIDSVADDFPRTRALYSYRFGSHNH